MKILFQCPRYFPSKGGIQTSIKNLGEFLKKEGHDISILCERTSNDLKEVEIIDGLKVFRFPKPWLNKYVNSLSFQNLQKEIKKFLKTFLKKNKFDIIISRAFFFISPTKKVAPGIPLIYIQPSISYIAMQKSSKNSKGIRRKINRHIKIISSYFLEKKALKIADRVLSRSKSMDYVNKNLLGVNKKMGKFYNVADLKRFKISRKNKNFIRRLGIKEEKIILAVSRLEPDKNNLALIEIFKNVKDKNAILLIVGGGREEKNLKDSIKKNNLGKKIFLIGERSDTEKFYNIADVFITASKQEGFPNVFLEAMASGVPIIGFKENPPRVTIPTNEFIEMNNAGFAVKNEKEMAEKIELLLKDEKLREKMGKAGRKEAEKYSGKKITDNLLKEINRMVKRK